MISDTVAVYNNSYGTVISAADTLDEGATSSTFIVIKEGRKIPLVK